MDNKNNRLLLVVSDSHTLGMRAYTSLIGSLNLGGFVGYCDPADWFDSYQELEDWLKLSVVDVYQEGKLDIYMYSRNSIVSEIIQSFICEGIMESYGVVFEYYDNNRLDNFDTITFDDLGNIFGTNKNYRRFHKNLTYKTLGLTR